MEDLEPSYTLVEAARLLHRSPKTLRNLVSLHQLPRRLIRQGRSPRRIMLLSRETVERLRRLTKT